MSKNKKYIFDYKLVLEFNETYIDEINIYDLNLKTYETFKNNSRNQQGYLIPKNFKKIHKILKGENNTIFVKGKSSKIFLQRNSFFKSKIINLDDMGCPTIKELSEKIFTFNYQLNKSFNRLFLLHTWLRSCLRV